MDKGQPEDKAEANVAKKVVKKDPINRAKLGPDYVAPDGGHGWFVALAAGCSNVSCTGSWRALLFILSVYNGLSANYVTVKLGHFFINTVANCFE